MSIFPRKIAPAAAPLAMKDLIHGIIGAAASTRYRENLERELKEYFSIPYVFCVSSGKAALYLTLSALKSLSPRRQVLIPAYTCFSVPSAVLKAGLELRLCDVSPDTFDFDPAFLESAVTIDTLCVIPTHLFGIPSDVDRVLEVARARGSFVVEDAAQAMGGKSRGQLLGTLGDVGVFSLGRGKSVTCGSGGFIVTRSRTIADAISREYAGLRMPNPLEDLWEWLQVAMMTAAIRPSLYSIPAAIPALELGQTHFYRDLPVRRLSGMKAGLLRTWLSRLEQSNNARLVSSSYFKRHLERMPRADVDFAYLRYPILLGSRLERDVVERSARESGLGVAPLYPKPISRIDELRSRFEQKDYAGAERIAERLLTLPTHPFLSTADREAIVALIEGAAQSQPTSSESR